MTCDATLWWNVYLCNAGAYGTSERNSPELHASGKKRNENKLLIVLPLFFILWIRIWWMNRRLNFVCLLMKFAGLGVGRMGKKLIVCRWTFISMFFRPTEKWWNSMHSHAIIWSRFHYIDSSPLSLAHTHTLIIVEFSNGFALCVRRIANHVNGTSHYADVDISDRYRYLFIFFF